MFSAMYDFGISKKQKGEIVKKLCQIFIVTVFVVTTSFSLYAHSGGTDSRGGHHNRSTGGYHYHHGMGPHQHPNGICPYSGSRMVIRILIVGGLAVGGYVVWMKFKGKS